MNDNALNRKFNTSALMGFALPNIIMMVFLSLYTIVDGMFVSRMVGSLALSALNMSWPIFSLELGISIMLSSGGSAIVAKKLGEGKSREAKEKFSFLLWITLFLGIAVNLSCLVFMKPLLRVLGTTDAQLPDCSSYTFLILIFSPAMFLQTFFQTFFVTAGKPGLGLGVTLSGGIANIILDYVFMGPLNLGIEGAAYATGIGYLIPAVFGFIYFTLRRKGTIYIVKCGFYGKTVLRACGNGASEMVTNTANSVTTFLFNILFLKFHGEDGVAAITIVMYFQFVFSSVFYGFSSGVAPVISYKYGADDRKQLKHIISVCLGFTLLSSFIMYLVSRLSIGTLLGIFTPTEGRVYGIALDGFPIYAAGFLFMGISIFASSMFTALSDGGASAVISFARTFIFLTASLLILPEIFGEKGIWLAVPVAEAAGLAVSSVFLIWGRKKYHY